MSNKRASGTGIQWQTLAMWLCFLVTVVDGNRTVTAHRSVNYKYYLQHNRWLYMVPLNVNRECFPMSIHCNLSFRITA